MALVPIITKPFSGDSLKVCPGCKAYFGTEDVHLVKTVHLWLNDAGACMVSEGVLEELKQAGMPDLFVENAVERPPTLQLGVPRERQDQEHRRIIVGRR